MLSVYFPGCLTLICGCLQDEQHVEQFALKFKDKELAETQGAKTPSHVGARRWHEANSDRFDSLRFRTAFDRAKVGQISGSPKATRKSVVGGV